MPGKAGRQAGISLKGEVQTIKEVLVGKPEWDAAERASHGIPAKRRRVFPQSGARPPFFFPKKHLDGDADTGYVPAVY
jgi:hypothetical protein